MSEKKRKTTTTLEERPNKKQQVTDTIKVRHVSHSGIAKPVIASFPGVRLPNELRFKSYSKKQTRSTPELLLYSTSHPRIDYTATEDTTSASKYNKHYVAVYDPTSGKLQVTESIYMTVRCSVRQIEAVRDNDAEEADPAVKAYASRAALTEAFGTKKSKKAVQSMAENRQLAQAGESASIADAMMEHISDDDEDQAGTSSPSRSHKPLPKANEATDDIEKVYDIEELVAPKPASDTLDDLPANKWIARLKSNKEIKSRSRFIANRIGYIGMSLLKSPNASDPKLKQCVQLLKYIELLIHVHSFLTQSKPRARIPFADKLPAKTFPEGTPISIIEKIFKRFLPSERVPTAFTKTLLRTTILALTLHIPPPSLQVAPGTLISDTVDIGLDLALDGKEIRKLYRELGCKVEAAREIELHLWGLEKIKATQNGVSSSKPMFAKLSLPLDFPKVSAGRAPPQRR